MISVVLLGAGNVASHLYNAFYEAENVTIAQWYNRTLKPIQGFSNQVAITDNVSQLVEADVYILAVSDDAIAPLSKALPFEGRLVLHTSGSTSAYDIDKKNRRGVFYPLQTFSKSTAVNFSTVPICLETLVKKDYAFVKTLARTITNKTHRINSDQRQALHLAAVFVNNFTNQLYRVAHEITESQGAEFDILKPLILETANKVQELSPYLAQTGPAIRNDKKTIKRHLKQLEKEGHREIYELLTQSIKKTHGKQ